MALNNKKRKLNIASVTTDNPLLSNINVNIGVHDNGEKLSKLSNEIVGSDIYARLKEKNLHTDENRYAIAYAMFLEQYDERIKVLYESTAHNTLSLFIGKCLQFLPLYKDKAAKCLTRIFEFMNVVNVKTFNFDVFVENYNKKKKTNNDDDDDDDDSTFEKQLKPFTRLFQILEHYTVAPHFDDIKVSYMVSTPTNSECLRFDFEKPYLAFLNCKKTTDFTYYHIDGDTRNHLFEICKPYLDKIKEKAIGESYLHNNWNEISVGLRKECTFHNFFDTDDDLSTSPDVIRFTVSDNIKLYYDIKPTNNPDVHEFVQQQRVFVKLILVMDNSKLKAELTVNDVLDQGSADI